MLLALGEIYIWGVHNYPVIKLTSWGARGPRSPMAEADGARALLEWR